jgi:hypothetical protein
MILKNSWGKYDNVWVIGDLALTVNPSFRMETFTKNKELVVFEGRKGIDDYISEGYLSEHQKRVCSVLLENIDSGRESMTCLDLAMEYCLSTGMFNEKYLSEKVGKYIEKIKNMSEEKDGFRFREMMAIIGGDPDNISDEGMEFVRRNAYRQIISDRVVPEYVQHDKRAQAADDFISSIRMAVTGLILIKIFNEAYV